MTNWISVKDRLPDKDGDYLCCTKPWLCPADTASINVYGFTLTAEKYGDFNYAGKKGPLFFGYDSEYGYYQTDRVTHWMPLPELPEVYRNKEKTE